MFAEHTAPSARSPVPKTAMRSSFPRPGEPAQIVTIPTYHPSTEQFMDPISYIQMIQSDAQPYGMCRIQPPPEWKVKSALKFAPHDLRQTIVAVDSCDDLR